MEERIKFFVGLDVHADTIEVAVAEAGRQPARCGPYCARCAETAEGAEALRR
jgi:hypothetical protein